jgi:hypothetical protein
MFFGNFIQPHFRENITDRVFKLRSDWNTIYNFDKPPISTNYLYKLYKQSAQNWSLLKFSIEWI